MKSTLPLVLLLGSCLMLNAQNKYDIALIKPALLENANAVIRFDDTNFEVKSAGKATEKTRYAVTILNQRGDDFSNFYSVYDQFSSISQLKAVVYNSKGEKIKEYSKNDFKDQSLISDFSIYEDNRYKSIKIYETSYPFTVEFYAVKDYNGILVYPQWSTLSSFNVSSEQSSYTISIPENLSLRYSESPLAKVQHQTASGRKTYSWQAADMKAFMSEPLSAGIKKLVPWVSIAPNEFDFDNSTGNFSTWASLGDWVNQLNKDGDVLNDAAAQKVKALTAGITDRRKKISVLYDYLQNSTRYVSVQLGIGGFKPIAAEKVSSVNYGDCKALSNYMKALLKQAGIYSELVLIRNQDGMNGSLSETFSSIGQANHMILCVPDARDTVWLECTSQRMPMGYLGGSNGNRKVLLITKDGGKIARTPFYTVNDNMQSRKCEVTVNASGSSVAKIKTEYEHEQFENVFGQLFLEPKDQKENLYTALDIANPEIVNFSYSQPDKSKPKIVEKVNLKINDLVTSGGDRLFLMLNMMNKRSFVPEIIENRQTDFALQMNYTDIDQIRYTLPADYKVEFLPKDIQISSDFGEYSVKTSISGNTLTYIRTQKMYSKQYPPNRFKELVDFYKSIYKADKQKAVLSKI